MLGHSTPGRPTPTEGVVKKNTIIICAFPGAGKSSAGSMTHKKVIDLDIHTFPKNQYPKNYVDAVKKMYESGEYDYILCACHESFRNALKDSGLHYIIVMPESPELCKTECSVRLMRAGKSLEYIEYVYSHWDDFFDSLAKDDSVKITLTNSRYLSDIL